MAAQGHLGATVHHIEKNHQTFLLVHVDYGGEEAIEGTVNDLDGLASLVGCQGANDGTVNLAFLQTSNKRVIDATDILAVAYDAANPVGRQDWPPAAEVDARAHKQVAREQRSQH